MNDEDLAWPYLFFNREQTISSIRWLNRETLLPWTLGLLLGIMDCGIDVDKRKDAKVLAIVREQQTAIWHSIVIVDSGSLIGELMENDEGQYFVARKLKTFDEIFRHGLTRN